MRVSIRGFPFNVEGHADVEPGTVGLNKIQRECARIGLKDEVTAITFVALGTSLPDTFASKAAAVNEKHADNAIGNVTGSNSVNVFLGLGLPWVIAAIYHAANGNVFNVPAGALTFSVTIYIICACVAVGLILVRRFVPAFGDGNVGAERSEEHTSELQSP